MLVNKDCRGMFSFVWLAKGPCLEGKTPYVMAFLEFACDKRGDAIPFNLRDRLFSKQKKQ